MYAILTYRKGIERMHGTQTTCRILSCHCCASAWVGLGFQGVGNRCCVVYVESCACMWRLRR